jgi:hypothetical protein
LFQRSWGGIIEDEIAIEFDRVVLWREPANGR